MCEELERETGSQPPLLGVSSARPWHQARLARGDNHHLDFLSRNLHPDEVLDRFTYTEGHLRSTGFEQGYREKTHLSLPEDS